MKYIFLSVLLLSLQACDQSAANYDSGYKDGYAEGYATACKVKSFPIQGNWDNEHYSRGYATGQLDGAAKGVSASRADNCKASVYH